MPVKNVLEINKEDSFSYVKEVEGLLEAIKEQLWDFHRDGQELEGKFKIWIWCTRISDV